MLVEVNDLLSYLAFVENVPHGLQSSLTRAALVQDILLSFRHQLEGVRQLGATEDFTVMQRPPPLTTQINLRIIGHQNGKPDTLDETQIKVLEHRIVHREAITSQLDSRSTQLSKRFSAVFLQYGNNYIGGGGEQLRPDIHLRHGRPATRTE